MVNQSDERWNFARFGQGTCVLAEGKCYCWKLYTVSFLILPKFYGGNLCNDGADVRIT